LCSTEHNYTGAKAKKKKKFNTKKKKKNIIQKTIKKKE